MPPPRARQIWSLAPPLVGCSTRRRRRCASAHGRKRSGAPTHPVARLADPRRRGFADASRPDFPFRVWCTGWGRCLGRWTRRMARLDLSHFHDLSPTKRFSETDVRLGGGRRASRPPIASRTAPDALPLQPRRRSRHGGKRTGARDISPTPKWPGACRAGRLRSMQVGSPTASPLPLLPPPAKLPSRRRAVRTISRPKQAAPWEAPPCLTCSTGRKN
jgi:hypothetical protein